MIDLGVSALDAEADLREVLERDASDAGVAGVEEHADGLRGEGDLVAARVVANVEKLGRLVDVERARFDLTEARDALEGAAIDECHVLVGGIFLVAA